MDPAYRRVPINTTISPRAHAALVSIREDLDVPRSHALDLALHIARRVLDAKCVDCDSPPFDASQALQRYIDAEIRRIFDASPATAEEPKS